MNPLKQEASREEKCPPLCVCGCPRDRHEIEPPYPCYDCGCEIYTIGHKGSATAQTPHWMTNGIPEDEEYIGFARWAGPTTSRYLALCDSDSLGAFKIFRRNIR